MAHEGGQSIEFHQSDKQAPPEELTALTDDSILSLAASLYKVARDRGIAVPTSFAEAASREGAHTDELAGSRDTPISQRNGETVVRELPDHVPTGRGHELALSGAAGTIALEASTGGEDEPSKVREALREQLESSTFAGHLTMVEQINKSREGTDKPPLEAMTPEAFVAEFADWFDQGRETYVAEAMEADPGLNFTLCAVPHSPVSAEEIIQDAREFHGDERDNQAIIASHALGQYTDAEISGLHPDNNRPIRFILIPNKGMPELGNTIQAQQYHLKELQKTHPFLGAPVPLIDTAYRHTIRAMSAETNEPLKGLGTQQKTYLRNFGMTPQYFDGNNHRDDPTFVPGSSIDNYGHVSIIDSYVPPISKQNSLVQQRLLQHSRVVIG